MIKLLSAMYITVAMALCASPDAAAADDDTAVRQLLIQMFDRPEARLSVEPVVVVGAYAVAGWGQGETGGRALLRRRDGHWTVRLCSGDALKDPAFLHHAGLDEAAARQMASAVVTAEAAMDLAARALLSRFDGVVEMDEAGGHPPSGKH